MSTKDKIKLAAADVLARVLVYGPLVVAAIAWSPMSLIVIGLAAGQPWVGEGLAKGGEWLTAKYPKYMNPVNNALSKWGGMPWWKHATFFITALAVAIVPAPSIAAHLPGVLKTVVGWLGGSDSIWTQTVLPFALATALPFATKLATDGFEWVFQKIPVLRDASIQRQEQRRDRARERAARAVAAAGHGTPDASPFETATAPDVAAAAPAPGVSAAAAVEATDVPNPLQRLERVAVPTRIRVISTAPRALPPVVRLATPPRHPVPRSLSIPSRDGIA